MTEYKKKLIEVALPLEAINRESAREKSIRHGHPSTLHLWWARRPLAACRAVLFASLVDDPSALPDQFPTEEAQDTERQRLFRIIEDLVKWENTTNEAVLETARAEIIRCTEGNPPPVLDPFCGGGSIPLEAQRLGLEAHASDLNPVAVLINKAMIEIPPKFAGLTPVNPEAQAKLGDSGWHGAEGLADDVRYYGRWMRDEAAHRIGHLYPKATLPDEQGGGEATAIAWLWARIVKCPNPACGADMPLVSSLWLSKKPGRKAWLEPRTNADGKTIEWTVRRGVGTPGDSPKAEGRGRGFRCLVCGNHADASYIHDEIDAGRQDRQLIAVVAAAPSGRAYLSPTAADVEAAQAARDACTRDISVDDLPDEPARGTFGGNAQGRRYGFRTFSDYFLPRQLTALTTFVALIGEARAQIRTDAASRVGADGSSSGDQGAAEYADAVATYLAFAIDKAVDYWSSVCGWHSSRELIRNPFARQAISMVWDSAEANPFSGGAGCWDGAVEWVARSVAALPALGAADVRQLDAMQAVRADGASLVSTDPPYYDNIGYADLADFFYVWLRRSLRDVYPDLFSTLLTPKRQELIASKYRFEGSSEKAQAFFESGLALVFERLRAAGNPDYPLGACPRTGSRATSVQGDADRPERNADELVAMT